MQHNVIKTTYGYTVTHEEKPHFSGIYQIKNTVTGKVWIGQAKDIWNRWVGHLYRLYRGINSPHLQNAWDKDGFEAFEFSILEVTQDLDARESFHIEASKSWDKQFGYNLERFDQRGNRTMSPESRKKLSEALKANPPKGHPQSKETREKISSTLKGSKKPEGHSRGEKNPQYGKTGAQNSQFGTKWFIGPEGQCTKFRPGEEPEGWIPGRRMGPRRSGPLRSESVGKLPPQ